MHASRITNILWFAATTQKFAVLHLINTVITALAGKKEDFKVDFGILIWTVALIS